MEETPPASRFIMVPVPRHLVLEVMRYVLRQAGEPLEEWELDSVGQLYGMLDPFPRRLLTHVAECTARGDTLTLSDAKELFDARLGDLFVAARDVIEAATHLKRKQPFGIEDVPVGPEAPDESMRVYVMDPDLADLILEHTQATAGDAQPR